MEWTLRKDWRTRDAWMCIASIISFQILIGVGLAFLPSNLFGIGLSSRSASGTFAISFGSNVIALMITFAFARMRSPKLIKEKFALWSPRIHTTAAAGIYGFTRDSIA